MRLLLKVSAIIIAVMFAGYGVVFYLTWFSIVETLAAQSKERLEELAITTMDKIDRTLFERGGDLEAIASDPIIRSRDSSPQQITERLIEYRNIYKTYASLSFFDLNRVRIADTTGLSLGKQDSKFRGWDEVLQGKLSLASDIGFSQALDMPVIFFASPVRDKNNELFGVVIIRVPVDKLYDIVGTLSLEPHIEENEHIDLIDKDGLVIYSNYNRNGMLREKLPYWETVKNKRGSAGFLKAHRHPGQEEYVAVFCREQGYLGFKGNEWTLIIHIPTSVIFAPVVELRNRWLLVIFPSAALAIIIALTFSFRLAKPLTRLRDAVLEVGKGGLHTRVMIKSGDEIGQLGDAFNRVVANLEKTTTSIDNLEREISKRKQAEETLKKSEMRFRTLYESSNDALMLLDEKGFRDCNEATIRMFGCRDHQEFYSKHPRELSPPRQADGTDSMELAKQRIATAIETGMNRFEWIHRRLDTGEDFPAEVVLSRMSLDGRTVLQATVRDITERKRSENYIHKLNQLQMNLLAPDILERQLNKITDGVVDIFKADFCRIWVIAQGDRCTTGCPHAAVTEGPHVCRYRDKCLHLVASSGRYTHLDGEIHRRVPFGCYKIGGIASGEYPSFLTNNVTNDPRVHNHEWAKELGLVSFAGVQLRPPQGETMGVLALFSQSVLSDEEYSLLQGIGSLTMRVIQTARVQETLRESERKYRSLYQEFNGLLNIIPDALVLLSPDFKIVWANESAASETGLNASELVGQYCYQLRHNRSEPCEVCPVQKSFQSGEAQLQEQVIPDGRIFELRAIPIGDDAEVKEVIELARDISEAKKVEEEREALIHELQDALKEVKALSGLLPICASCKKIRDDKGYWSQIESYIADHSEAEFSHGICPECAKKLYPEVYKKMYPESSEGK